MADFKGFPAGKDQPISLPEVFFREILPAVDQIEELKVLLYIFWRFNRIEGHLPYLWMHDFLADQDFMSGLGKPAGAAAEALERGLQLATARGVLLEGQPKKEGRSESIFLLNTARGRAAIDGIKDGSWSPTWRETNTGTLADRPTIFHLYEENIGPLTPLIAETLKDAETEYPSPWIEEAIKIAVENNVRRWRYIDAILRNWREEGKDERQTRGDLEEDRHKYVRGKFSKYIEH